MLSRRHPDQGHKIDCVIGRIGETEPGQVTIADIVADHRPAPAVTAARAARVLASLPGCSVFLAPDGRGGYLAFARDGRRFSIRRVPRQDGDIPAAAAEACVAVLYARVCADQVPAVAIVAAATAEAHGQAAWFAAIPAVAPHRR